MFSSSCNRSTIRGVCQIGGPAKGLEFYAICTVRGPYNSVILDPASLQRTHPRATIGIALHMCRYACSGDVALVTNWCKSRRRRGFSPAFLRAVPRKHPCRISPNRTPRSATRCARSAPTFPTSTSAQVDEARGYPEDFVDALTKAGWLAALIPAGIRRLGPGPDRSLGHHGGDQPLGRQLRRLPRPDVQHGHAAAPRLGGAEAAATCRRSPAASCACSRWA